MKSKKLKYYLVCFCHDNSWWDSLLTTDTGHFSFKEYAGKTVLHFQEISKKEANDFVKYKVTKKGDKK